MAESKKSAVNFHKDLLPQIESLVAQSFRSVTFSDKYKIDPRRRNFQYELFGFDFMINQDFDVFLIEINSNPCISMHCPILSRMIPRLLENAFRIAIDPILPPAELNFKRGYESVHENLFKLIFDEKSERSHFNKLLADSPAQSPTCTFCN